MPPSNLSQYYQSKGQALPTVASRAGDATKAGITGAYTGTADQNNQLLSYYALQDKNVPTSAPVVKTPSPVVSAGLATDLIQGQAIPTMNTANTQIGNAALAAKEKAANDALLASKTTPVTPTAPLTPEQQIASNPDAGNQWIYDRSTGAQTQVKIGTPIPNGYSTVDFKNAPAVDTTTSADGNITFKKLSDGSYGKYDTTSGQYVGMSNDTQFNLMKTGQAAKAAYDNAIANGPLLNESQKAQIKSVADTYQRILNQQSTDNQNFTGGTSIAQNLYGLGGSVMGLNAIKSSVDAGAAKISDINSKMNGDIAKMTAAFQSDNLGELKAAYTSFQTNSSSLQKAIDSQHAEAVQLERDRKQQTSTAIAQVDNDIRGLLDTASKNDATSQQLNDMTVAAANHDYAGVVKAGGDSLLSASGIVGEYNTYKRDATARGLPVKSFDEFLTLDANRKVKIAAAGFANGYSNQTMTKVTAIAGTFYNEPSVKNYQVVIEGKQFMDSIPDNTQNPSDQQGIIYAFAKIMDPNSVVRESEYATVQKYAQSWAQKFGFNAERIYSNSPFLTEEAIRNMKATVASKVLASEKNYKNIYNEYGRRIDKVTKGTDGTEYITDYSKGFTSTGDKLIQTEDNATKSLDTWKQQNPQGVQKMLDFGASLEKTLGRPVSDSEFLENYPQYGGKQSFNNVGGDTNTASQNKIVGGIDLNGYAVDPNQSKAVATIYNNIPNTNNPADYTSYIKSKSPNSRINGNDVVQAANNYNLDPKILLALMQHESNMGTSTVALKNNNFGGITWSPSYAKNNPGVIKGTPRPASEGGYYVKFVSPLAGLMAQAKLLNNRKIS